MNSFSPEILSKVKNLPNRCGCYLFEDKGGEVIYVGKAQNLKNRVSSYFQKNLSHNYFQQQIYSFTTILTLNVKEALILEQNLIKKHQPRFNVLLKDSNYYPYLEVTGDKNPRYRVVRKIDLNKKGEYYGPFPDGSKAREILQLLERLFPLAKCKGNLGKPCFYYNINQCSGHCWQKVEPIYYEKTKEEIRKFFSGKTHNVKQKIKNSLQKNIANLAFEIAHKEKKILDNIDFFTSKQNVELSQNNSPKSEENNCDFLGIHYQEVSEKESVISLFLFLYRYGRLTNTSEGTFPVWTNQEEVIQSYLYQFYRKNLPPKVLYLPAPLDGQELLAEEFGFLVKIPMRGKKKEILNLAQQNAHQTWQKNYWNEFQQVNKNQILVELSNFLSIPIPYYIECLDISNLYKQDVVAGFLVFTNGEKDLSRSKLYRLDSQEGNDSDIDRIKEATLLHYQNFSVRKIPDLIIVDGGKEQVKVVVREVKKFKSKIFVIGLAKDENHRTAKVITSDLRELDFVGKEKVKNFLANCQEEVHRYAISFHRKLHRRSALRK